MPHSVGRVQGHFNSQQKIHFWLAVHAGMRECESPSHNFEPCTGSLTQSGKMSCFPLLKTSCLLFEMVGIIMNHFRKVWSGCSLLCSLPLFLGPVGTKGEKGDRGYRGEKGDRGPIGPKGESGFSSSSRGGSRGDKVWHNVWCSWRHSCMRIM